jgi:hypothetical protein
MDLKTIKKYQEYVGKRGTCIEVFKSVAERFNIKTGIYPGSYIHITPSLVIPEMYYVDTDKKALKFFDNIEVIKQFIAYNKIYEKEPKLKFEGEDFNSKLHANISYYDLMISLYSGFISDSCKKYLKIGGIFLVNDSHGDATLAYFNSDYDFIGIIKETKTVSSIITNGLEQYFIPKNQIQVDIETVRAQMKGPKYKIRADYYLFKRIA